MTQGEEIHQGAKRKLVALVESEVAQSGPFIR